MIRILGIDPGHIHIGFAILDFEFNNGILENPQIIFAQDVDLSSYNHNRYLKLFNITNDIIQTYKPNYAIIEKTIVRNNTQTSLLLSQSRGVILLSCENETIEYKEIANNKIKKYFCSKGNATKSEISSIIQSKFNINLLPNANDAIMIAYCGKIIYDKNDCKL